VSKPPWWRTNRLQIPGSDYIEAVQVRSGLDVADGYIVQHLQPEDLVITADIPLAAAVIAGGGYALNPRGEFYTANNVRERLALRDFMDATPQWRRGDGGTAHL
jgi:uncharacterized protein YaiI (UPF0178 family)